MNPLLLHAHTHLWQAYHTAETAGGPHQPLLQASSSKAVREGGTGCHNQQAIRFAIVRPTARNTSAGRHAAAPYCMPCSCVVAKAHEKGTQGKAQRLDSSKSKRAANLQTAGKLMQQPGGCSS